MTINYSGLAAQDQCMKDFAGLEQAVKAYQQALAQKQAAEAEFNNTVIPKLRSIASASSALVYLATAVFQNNQPPSAAGSDASILGIFGDKVGLQGKKLDVMTYLTAIHNDMQKLVNSGSSKQEVVWDVASDLDAILGALHGTDTTIGTTLQDILGSSFNDIVAVDTALRNQISLQATDTNGYTDGNGVAHYYDPYFNGTSDYHFVDNLSNNIMNSTTTNKLEDFAQMQTDMQTPGNAYDASGAYKALTDNFNSAGSMYQSINAAVNEQVNQITKFIQTLLGFYENGLLKPWMTLANLAIQGQRVN